MSQYSFRRILLSRLLLLTLPVLIVGVGLTYGVTYRKARSALLETARQNVTESAVKKGESLQELIELLETNLVNASNSNVLQSGTSVKKQEFVQEQLKLLPQYIDCVQISSITEKKIKYSTCGQKTLGKVHENIWDKIQNSKVDKSHINVKYISPNKSIDNISKQNQNSSYKQLELLLTAPVYDNQGSLIYLLCFKVSLLKLENLKTGSLTGYPVIINEEGNFLVHPFPEKIDRNIRDEDDKERLSILLNNAINGRQDFLHLFSLEKNGTELLAGYTAIPSPISHEKNQKWVVLAVTSLDSALAQLQDIQKTLFQLLLLLVIGLTLASLIAIIYLSSELSDPLEKLRNYAITNQQIQSNNIINYQFKIKEIKELYRALNQMIDSLKAGAKEIEKAWQDARNANQLKNEFLANTSHELRTPLNGIIGSIRLIKDGYCDSEEEELEFLEKADQAAVHLLKIINDVLDISKIEAGQISLDLKLIDFKKLLDDVINLQIGLIKSKDLQLKVETFCQNIKIYADYHKLKQVLINVIGNAVKFTDNGGIILKIYLKEKEENPKKLIVVEVKDTGIGIPQNQQNKLFQPFVMVDGSTTRKFGGTGLGLAISKNLIEMMGGSISLFSLGENQGTTVTISIPIAK